MKKSDWQGLPEPYDKDFRYFLVLVWRHLQVPDPTIVQLDIAEYMQGGQKRRIIEAFRGVGKSWMAAAYVLWLLRNDPQKKIMVVSASKTRADDFAQFCLRIIQEMPMLLTNPQSSQFLPHSRYNGFINNFYGTKRHY